MLQKIRDTLKSQSWLAIVLLGALALIFAAWGAYGIVNINFGAGDYAAKVGSEKLSLQEVRDDWMRAAIAVAAALRRRNSARDEADACRISCSNR